MRPKQELDPKIQTGTFILSEKIDDTKSKKSDKDTKKEMKKLEKEKLEREKREKKAKEKEKEREKQAKKGKVVCGACGGKCSGEVLRVSDKYFHRACFTCRSCAASLASGGFFARDGHYYCPQDYQRAFGTRCAACRQYVEGEVVSALGNTYHQKCFTCARCKRAFPSGEKVTYTGSEVVCSTCLQPQRATARATAESPSLPPSPPTTNGGHYQNGHDSNKCAGCDQELSEGQALVALDRQWHTWCFTCAECGRALAGEYMGRAGVPYCERDYQRLHGVRCAYCRRYIAGKVLQAGENHHFHPTCARCCKCGEPFGDGAEMFLQGAAVWHPACGPAPGDPLLLDTQLMSSRSPSANGSLYSPYSSLNRKSTLGGAGSERSSSPHRVTAYSYLTHSPRYLRRLLQPSPPADTHFHRPHSACSTRASSRAGSKTPGGGGTGGAGGMRALVEAMARASPRPASPGSRIDNEEPIELAAYPAAHKPAPGETAPLERDDFPAPPYPYTDPERRRRWSDTYKGVPDSDEERAVAENGGDESDARLRREEVELAKIQSGIAQVFLKEVKEREKLQQWKKQNLDPRSASRSANARHEPSGRLRYASPVGASPSRCADRSDRSDRTDGTMLRPRSHTPTFSVAGRSRAPRPGYGLATSHRSHTFSSTAGDFTLNGLGDKTHSTDFSSGKSDISAGSITDVDRSAVRGIESGSVSLLLSRGGARRSLPNMVTSALLHQPAALYPYHLLSTENYRLPPSTDRLNLERHLSDTEFEAIFQMTRGEFYRMPIWRRNDLKRRARLF